MQETIIRILLAPFSAIYGLGLLFRNVFYDSGIIKSTQFNIPVISIGNLSIGGAGKSPHVEYLAYFLSEYLPIGILSRGYKRRSKGFAFVKPTDDVFKTGDEPLQFARKFKNTVVAVSESRAIGIPLMLRKVPQIACILLDDAFQHRSVTPEVNILVTEYDAPYWNDALLPAGRLREYKSAAERADIIIVSKCPTDDAVVDRDAFVAAIEPLSHQKIYFSRYIYSDAHYLLNNQYKLKIDNQYSIILLTAIASEDYLLQYLEPKVSQIISFRYEDHHYFKQEDMNELSRTFHDMPAEHKFIITTEKDATRLEMHQKFIIENKLPIFVLPIKVEFLFDDAEDFQALIKKYLLNFTV